LGALQTMREKYRDRVDFVVVYIREAHPEDGWVVTPNRSEGIALVDPTSTAERTDVAEACALRLKIAMPVVVDEITDSVASAYGALPDRLYLVGKGGRIAFQGEPGPFGFRPADLENAIEAELARSA
jgi:hypothetical protein